MKARCGQGGADVGEPPRERFLVLAPSLGEGGGIQCVVDAYVRALADRTGAEVDFWAWRAAVGGRPPAGGLCNSRLHWRHAAGSRLRFLVRTMGALRQSWTHVFVMHADFAPVYALARHGGRRQRVSLVLYGVEAWQQLRGLKRIGVAGMTDLLSISQTTETRFRAVNPDCALVCRVIRPCLAHDWFAGVPVDSGLVERGAVDVLCVGRMAACERYKGFDELLDSLALLQRRGTPLRAAFVGDGDDRVRLMERGRELGLGDAVVWPGYVSPSALREYYHDCAVFAMPSRGEGFGLVYGEAMSYGKPFIAGQGDAGEELAKASGCGVAVNPADAGQLADAMIRYARMPDGERLALAAKAAAWARDALSYETFCAELHRYLDTHSACTQAS